MVERCYGPVVGTDEELPGSAAVDAAWQILGELAFGQGHLMREAAAEVGLTPAHFRALMELDSANPRPMRDLAELLHVDASFVTGLVDQLERHGYAERRPSAADRRVKTVALTPLGARVREQARAGAFRAPEALRRLSAADQEALLRIVRRAVPERVEPGPCGPGGS